jgi:ketosteroid isomerase-like protein
MVRRYIALFTFGVISALTFSYTLNAWQTDPIIALERGALDRWGKGDPGGYLELYATDVTYFDPQRETRVNGLSAMKRLLEPIKGTFKSEGYEIIEPRVQRAGAMAVLTYNLVSRGSGPDGKPVVARWNSTAVYTQVGDRWKIIHSHWSFTKPELKAAR